MSGYLTLVYAEDVHTDIQCDNGKKCLEQELLTNLINPNMWNNQVSCISCLANTVSQPQEVGEGGILQMGVKIKTPKIPYGYHQNPQKILGSKINHPPKKKNAMSNFLALKFPESKTSLVVFIHRTTWLEYARTTTNLQIVLNTQKFLTKSSEPKKHSTSFPGFSPTPKNIILLSSPSLEILSTPLGS